MAFLATPCLSQVFPLRLQVSKVRPTIYRLVLSSVLHNRHSRFLVLVVVLNLLLELLDLFLLVVLLEETVIFLVNRGAHLGKRHDPLLLVIGHVGEFINP